MQEIILIKLGEIVLKGLNRKVFETLLLKNIRRRVSPKGEYAVRSAQSTIYVTPQQEDLDLDEAAEKIGKIFGIVAYTRSCIVEKELSEIQAAAVTYLREQLSAARTFKVESKRADKKFPMGSIEISTEVGGYILEHFPNLTVDVHNPDVTVRVEIREAGAYVHG
ncbi:MAG: THUMP domain-containing protein, partial [Oscillospiraceae bacterium]